MQCITFQLGAARSCWGTSLKQRGCLLLRWRLLFRWRRLLLRLILLRLRLLLLLRRRLLLLLRLRIRCPLLRWLILPLLRRSVSTYLAVSTSAQTISDDLAVQPGADAAL